MEAPRELYAERASEFTVKLVLIDFSSIAYPLWYVHGADADPNSTSTHIIERVRALASGQPHVAICCDGKGKTFRHALDPTYKAQREAKPAALYHQIGVALDVVRADGFPVWTVDGFEADDVIASAAWRVSNPDLEVLVISADKDLLQLVNEHVGVMSPATDNTMDLVGVREKLGIEPSQMLDYLSLCGDASDNIKGADGIGAKKAAQLLATFGTLEDLYAAMDKGDAKLPPAQFASLLEFRGRWPLVRSLITLRTDVPIPFEEVLRERVPADVAEFGTEGDMNDDIEFAMPSAQQPTAFSSPFVALPTEKMAPPNKAQQAEIGNYLRSEANRVADEVGMSDTDKQRLGIFRSPIASDAALPAQAAVHGRVVPSGGDSGLLSKSTPRDGIEWTKQLEPMTMQQAVWLSQALFKARLFSAYGTPEGVLSTIIAGRELGMPVMHSLRAFHIVQGKPTLAADVLRAMVIRSGLAKYFRCTERTAERATFETQRGDDPPISLSYTLEEAKASGRVKGDSGYSKDPADMLVARAGSKLARLVYADVIHGIYSPEEMES